MPHRENMSQINSIQAWVIVLLAVTPGLMNQHHILNKVSLSKHTHETRLCIGQGRRGLEALSAHLCDSSRTEIRDPLTQSCRWLDGVHWKDWCWSWNSNTLATWCEDLTHLKRPWCWERLRAGREGDDRAWDGWMASPTQWTWVWVNSGSWWWTGRPDVLRFMGSQRVGHDWVTELNWWNLNNWATRTSWAYTYTHTPELFRICGPYISSTRYWSTQSGPISFSFFF